MFFAENNFDASKVAPDNGFEPLPTGAYTCTVAKAEEKACSNNGEQLVLELRVVEGKYAKRTLFHRITLKNKSAQAVSIGLSQLSALCRACGLITPKGAHEFANKMLRVTVDVVKRTDNDQLTNKVKKVEPVGGVGGAVPAAVPTAPEPAPTGTAPWAAAV